MSSSKGREHRVFEGKRRSGVLLHPSSLPGPGIGDLGDAAYRFVDWLADAGQSFWQILPLGPVDPGGSPYNSLSALAGNALLISIERLRAEGLVSESPEESEKASQADRIDYGSVRRTKERLLQEAYRSFRDAGNPSLSAEFDAYRRANESWLPDYALFRAARDHHRDAAWNEWEVGLREREPESMRKWTERLDEEIERYAFQQFLFDRQWRHLRQYANERGVWIMGDLPIFVAFDSADVWANRDIFELDDEGRPTVVAGVPPDYFSETGQRWGNPLYRWDKLRESEYDWWVKRFQRAFHFVDLLRIDHFRGFESYWEIDAREETAINGRWLKGPGREFFDEIERQLGPLPLIAEDLGMITRDVERLRDDLELPGMRVLQFGFDGDPRNPHLPENCPERSVAYTGTHDNDTVAGWWSSLGDEERRRVARWLDGREPTNWTFIEAVLSARSSIAVVPLQDVLNVGSEGRMNTPGVPSSNWTWRMTDLPGAATADRLREVTTNAGRAPGIDRESYSTYAEQNR